MDIQEAINRIEQGNIIFYDVCDNDPLHKLCIEGLKLLQQQKDGLVVELPARIGQDVFVAGSYEETDGSTVYCVDKTKLTGFINEDGRKFYLCYDKYFGSVDVDPDLLFSTQAEAETKIQAMAGGNK